jgi:endonuclease G, mitochondrial
MKKNNLFNAKSLFAKGFLAILFATFTLLPVFAQNETFEAGSKNGYAAGDEKLSSGVWNLSDALIGESDRDFKNGGKSVRLKDGGKATMKFDINASGLTLSYAAYDTDKTAALELWISTDGGSNWKKAGVISNIKGKLENAKFGVNGKVRVEIRNVSNSGARINIDDISWGSASPVGNNTNGTVADNGTKPVPNVVTTPSNVKDNDHLLLGNPSNAQTNVAQPENYLMLKKQYALSYSKSRGTPNWVAWHFDDSWKGDAKRSGDFEADAELPAGWYKVTTRDYAGSGFDRGHMCPSDDRDNTDADNKATFLMTNIIPQTARNNQETWRLLEEYARRLVTHENKELYVICGSYGKGGTNKDKERKNELADGKITVPARIWKIIVVLDKGSNDLQRINANTRVIAIDTPNMHNTDEKPLGSYRVSVRAIEKATGYNFFSNLPQNLQDILENKVDNEAVH